jgi:large subunit ribosomal protein L5
MAETATAGIPRLKERYQQEIAPALKEQFGYKNNMAVPRVLKVCINMGVGKAREDAKMLEQAVSDIGLISGQKGVITKARKSISNFKLRRGFDVGCRVTLRGVRMYEFLDRLISLAIPNIRDFRGVSPKGFDGRGNYTMGLSEQTVFPEIDPDKVSYTQGMHISIVTSARTDDEGRALLKLMGMPFSRRQQQQ